jgi:hypothetical protein
MYSKYPTPMDEIFKTVDIMSEEEVKSSEEWVEVLGHHTQT